MKHNRCIVQSSGFFGDRVSPENPEALKIGRTIDLRSQNTTSDFYILTRQNGRQK